jgi:serine/threonine-protein kinase
MSSTRCSACGSDIAAESRFCASCGANLAASAVVTAPPAASSPAPVARGFRLLDHRSLGGGGQAEGVPKDGRFPVGIILGERYRILGLLGRGGMGEVYRAHDLKLEQQVALKFLPESAASNPSLMERFRGEVRIARQVSHRNVCRVYDIGDVNGVAFISMEYVDGEDLASLLRRIGRLPGDKALEFARKLCAGLAAAHEKGVLHRDLKPANIMIDGRGQLLIMDFGLAAVADAITGHDIRSGTPAYLSPEQRDGREVTVRSDIYALGIVLAEMFTGSRPAADGTLSATTKDVDPVVERVVQRCVDASPASRFASALDIARALPDGDPLAEALAAGETPSPEMVAASDETGVLSVRATVLCLAVIVAGLIGVVIVGERLNPARRTPFRQPPDVIAAKARDIAERLGYTNVADSFYALFSVAGLDEYARDRLPPNQYDAFIKNPRTSPVRLFYRQSPRPLDALDDIAGVSNLDPPPIVAGMVEMTFDPEGRLVSLAGVPPQVIESAAPRTTDWKTLFDAAGLDSSRWTPAQPRWLPIHSFDERAAWDGSFPHAPSVPMHIDAAAWRGRPVQFDLQGPWSLPTRDTPRQLPRGLAGTLFMQTISLWSVVFVGVLLAAKHLRSGRADLAGGGRLAAFAFTCALVWWALYTHHVATRAEEGRIIAGIGAALTNAAFFGMLYLALEPIVRRRWPQSLIAWTRLLDGAVRDRVVNGHALVGIAIGVATTFLFALAPVPGNRFIPLDPRQALAEFVRAIGGEAIGIALGFFFAYFLFRALLRRAWLATASIVVIIALFGLFRGPWGLVVLSTAGLVLVWVINRFGLLATVTLAALSVALDTVPMTTDLSGWDAPGMLTILSIILAISLWCFRHALGGRRLLKADLLDA